MNLTLKASIGMKMEETSSLESRAALRVALADDSFSMKRPLKCS